MSSFTKLPRLIALPPDYDLYEVQVAFDYHVGSKDSIDIIHIEKGFVCDGASIPQFAWSLIGGPLGPYAPAAVVHDKLYKTQKRLREESDLIFYEAMQVLKVPFWKRWTMYHSVRTCGWMPWNNYKKIIEKTI